MRHGHPVIAAIGAALACFVVTTTAQAAVEGGTLACSVSGSAGFIIGSPPPLAGTDNGPTGREHDLVAVTKFGMASGYRSGGEIVREVAAPKAAVPWPPTGYWPAITRV
jgi:hypothetical protein